MLSQTAILAIRAAVLLACSRPLTRYVRPEDLAHDLKASPTYTAKVLSALVRAGICESRRGARGGLRLARPPADITMRELVEAAQGVLVGDFCEEVPKQRLARTCAFHQACHELHEAMVNVLERWTLAQLAERPAPVRSARLSRQCLIDIAIPRKAKKGVTS